MFNNKRKCIIDFETTGSNLFEDEPIQIGALLVDEDSGVLKEYSSFIRPSKVVENTEKAFQIHGISLDELHKAPSQKEVLEKFFSVFGYDYSFAGWNISFDIPFFRKMCFENGLRSEYDKINYRHLDIQSVCQLLKRLKLVDNDLNSLSDFASYFNIQRSSTHDALEDVKITYELYLKVFEVLKENTTKKTSFLQNI
jgi:DNA polymerase-3 subunit epsilon